MKTQKGKVEKVILDGKQTVVQQAKEGFLEFKCAYCGAFAKPGQVWTCWRCGKSQE